MTRAELTRDDGIATVALCGDDGLNVLHDELVDELLDVVDEVGRGRDRALVLRGRGANFSAGGDLAHLASLAERVGTADGRHEVSGRIRRNAVLVERIRALDILTIAAIDGACVGAALGIAAACDLRVATTRAIFTTGFLRLGLVADFGAAALLTEAIGASRATDWLLRPRRRTADEARSAGFVADVVEPGELDEAIVRFTEAARFPMAVAGMKAGVRDGAADLSAHLDAECERFVTALGRDEAREAILASSPRR